MDFANYDLTSPNAFAVPPKIRCSYCGKLTAFSPITVITFGGLKKVVEDACDDCCFKLHRSGEINNVKFIDNNKNYVTDIQGNE